MRSLRAVLLLAAAPLALNAAAQSTPKAPAVATHPTVAQSATSGRAGCVKLPDISPKVPALPTNAPCARHLYSVSTVPNIRLDYVSPLEGRGLRETLGVDPLSFSLDYIDTKVGSGPLAAPGKWYTVNYTGYLLDGTRFDSSLDAGREPFTIPYGQHGVIPGWDTGFDGMRVGGKRRLFIPYPLAYGTKGSPPVIPPKAELIFDIELLAQGDERPAPKAPPAPPASAKPVVPESTTPPTTAVPPASSTAPSSTPPKL